jgi:hypothetical protein
LRAKKVPTPSLFLCKCSFRESCTCGLRKLEPDDWERFQGAEELTQSARRHREHGEKGDGLKDRKRYFYFTVSVKLLRFL